MTDNGSAETTYYAWVDQHDTLGLGKDVPIATGNQNDSLIALVDGKLVNLLVPYPMGFCAKGLDGRIDDPNAGWKGRGVWSNTGNRTPFHIEGGKGTRPRSCTSRCAPIRWRGEGLREAAANLFRRGFAPRASIRLSNVDSRIFFSLVRFGFGTGAQLGSP